MSVQESESRASVGGKHVKFEVTGRIAYITLDRPEARNALNNALRTEFTECLTEVQENPDIWVAILSGTDPAFSAGADLKEKLASIDTKGGVEPNDALYLKMRDVYKPVVAALNGACLAQGAGLALLSDIRVMSEKAFMGWPQVKRGISSISGPLLLTEQLPHSLALRYLITGDFIYPEDSLKLGLVHEVVPHEKLLSAAEAWAEKIMQNAPLSVRAIKEGAVRTIGMAMKDSLPVGRKLADEIYASEDAREGLLAFKEKREPNWKGQ
jgi:enoyl-CoA hydratase/carnithine racemase